MSGRNYPIHENYLQLLHNAKPGTAGFLQEKYHYWKEVYLSKVREGMIRDLKAENERLLYLRQLSGIFQDPGIMEKTGYAFGGMSPGIEFSRDKESAFDIYLKGRDGSALFILFLSDQGISTQGLINSMKIRYEFIIKNQGKLRKSYSIEGKTRFAFLLPEREKGRLRKALQALGRRKALKDIGEVHVIELILEENILRGLPAIPKSTPDLLAIPEGAFLHPTRLDLQAGNYTIFELTVIQECYARHLMKKQGNPKQVSYKEMEEAFLRVIGVNANEKNDKKLEKRREFATKRLTGVLEMALRYNLMEETGEKDRRYRLICPGTDLPMVQRNLLKKYLEGGADEEASGLAREKAVEEYRKRFPRIDKGF